MVVCHQFQGCHPYVLLSMRESRPTTHSSLPCMDAIHECTTRRGWTVIDTVEAIASSAKDYRPKRQALLACLDSPPYGRCILPPPASWLLHGSHARPK
jgi:hypothetical protein